MVAINVDKRLCVKGHLVPVKQDTLSFVDPYKLAEEEPEEDLPVTLVDFQARKNAKWLEAPLVLHQHWWRYQFLHASGTHVHHLQQAQWNKRTS